MSRKPPGSWVMSDEEHEIVKLICKKEGRHPKYPKDIYTARAIASARARAREENAQASGKPKRARATLNPN